MPPNEDIRRRLGLYEEEEPTRPSPVSQLSSAYGTRTTDMTPDFARDYEHQQALSEASQRDYGEELFARGLQGIAKGYGESWIPAIKGFAEKFLTPGPYEGRVERWASERQAEYEDWSQGVSWMQPNTDYQDVRSPKGMLASAVETITQSMVAGAPAGVATTVLGGGPLKTMASILLGADMLFSAAQYSDVLERADMAQIPREESEPKALESAGWELAGGVISTAAAALTLLATKDPKKKAAAAVVVGKGLRQVFSKSLGRSMARIAGLGLGEATGESVTAIGQAEIERDLGLGNQTNADAIKDVFGVSFLVGVMTGGMADAGMQLGNKRDAKILSDGRANPLKRLEIAANIEDQLKAVDPDVAKTWARASQAAILQGGDIDLDVDINQLPDGPKEPIEEPAKDLPIKGQELQKAIRDAESDVRGPAPPLMEEPPPTVDELRAAMPEAFVARAQVVPPEGERIVSAITRIGEKTYEGKTHGETINQAIEAGDIVETEEGLVDREGNDLYGTAHSDWFKTNTGRIVDRFQASREFGIAAAENITTPEKKLQVSLGPTFYSQFERVADKKLPGKMTTKMASQQIDAMLKKGEVKQEEVDTLGIKEWLEEEGDRKISKEELMEWTRGHQLELEETTLAGHDQESMEDIREQYVEREMSRYEVSLDEDEGGYVIITENGDHWYDEGGTLKVFPNEADAKEEVEFMLRQEADSTPAQYLLEYMNVRPEDVGEGGPAKYETYTLPGGENYKELLLRMPPSTSPAYQAFKAWQDRMAKKYGPRMPVDQLTQEENEERVRLAKAAAEDPGQEFVGGHWTEPNVLAHVRMNDRVDAEGKKTLFLEELQSDWHQMGKKRGYAKDLSEDTPLVAEPVLAAGQLDHYQVNTEDGRFVTNVTPDAISVFDQEHAVAEARRRLREAPQRTAMAQAVPDAPFKKTWPLLVMKRMIREAAEKGYDSIAWTTGEQQADRYDLSRQVDAIRLSGDFDQSIEVSVAPKGSRRLIGETAYEHLTSTTKEQLEDVIGKELAEKALTTDQREFSGLDLKVGGEGMKRFYDDMLPRMMNKYAKKWGAKVEEAKIPSEDKTAKPHMMENFRTGVTDADVQAREAIARQLLPDRAKLLLEQPEKYKWIVRDANQEIIDVFGSTKEAEKYLADNWDDLGGAGTTVHSLPITPEMKAAVLGGGQPLFQATKAKPKAGWEPPPAPLSSERLGKALPGAKVERTFDGYRAELPNGMRLFVNEVGKITLDEVSLEAVGKTYGVDALAALERGFAQIAGSFVQQTPTEGLIKLSKHYETPTTLDHEVFHAAMAMALTPAEQQAVLAEHGNEEKAAQAYAEWDPKTPNTLFQKILDFFQQMLHAIAPNVFTEPAQKVFGRVKTGEAWKRESPQESIPTRGRELSQRDSSLQAEIKSRLPKDSPWRQAENFQLVKREATVRKRVNTDEETRIYEVSVLPAALAKGDKPARKILRSIEQARKLNAHPERVKDYLTVYAKAPFIKDAKNMYELFKNTKLKDIWVVHLTRGCQRAHSTVERVANGILPAETRIEACFGGICWVNRQFSMVFGNHINMELRDLEFMNMDRMRKWMSKKGNLESLNKSQFIRCGQKGCDSHAIANGTALEWLHMGKELGLKPKTIFITAGYGPVTDEQYAALAPYADRFEIHFSNSGWFHKNEIMIRLGEFVAARDAGLPATMRVITNADNIAGVKMVNEEFLIDQMRKAGVTQSEILETPFHEDVFKRPPYQDEQDRSEPCGKFKNICCETPAETGKGGVCRACGPKCMTNVDKAAGATVNYQLVADPTAKLEAGTGIQGITESKLQVTEDPDQPSNPQRDLENILPVNLKAKAKEILGNLAERNDSVMGHYARWLTGRLDPDINVILREAKGPQLLHHLRNMEGILSQTKPTRVVYETVRKFKEDVQKKSKEWHTAYKQAVAGLSNQEKQAVLNLLDTEQEITGEGRVEQAAAQVRGILDNVHEYMTQQGYDMGYIQGYLPHIFQGRFWVKEEGGFAQKVDTFGEALKIADRVARETGQPVTVMQDTFIPPDDATILSQRAYWKLIQNLRTQLGEAVPVMDAISADEARAMIEGVAKPMPRPRFFGNMQSRIVNNPNFIRDLDEVMGLYFYGASRKVHQDVMWKDVQTQLESMPESDRGLRKFVEDVYMPQALAHPSKMEEGIARLVNKYNIFPWKGVSGQDVRKTMHNVNLVQYVWDLGVSFSSAVANASQFWMLGYPIVGERHAASGYLKGMQTFKDAEKFKEVEEMGITQAVSSITGQVLLPGQLGRQFKDKLAGVKDWRDGVRAVMESTLIPFSTVELANRFSTYWAGKEHALAELGKGTSAVKLAKKVAPETSSLMDMARAIDAGAGNREAFAKKYGFELNEKVNFRVGRENLPQLLQNPSVRFLSPYKSFLLNYLKKTAEYLSPKGVVTDPKRALRFTAMTIGLSGLRGNPILWAGFLAASKLWEELYEEDLAYHLQRGNLGKGNFLLRGATGELGLDISGSVAILLPQRTEDFLGRFGQLILNAGRAAHQWASEGGVSPLTSRKVGRLLLPSQAQRVVDAFSMIDNQEYRSPITKTPVALKDPFKAAVQRVFGGLPREVGKTFDQERAVKSKIRKYKELSRNLTERWATAIQEGNRKELEDVLTRVVKESYGAIERLGRAVESNNERALMEAMTDVAFWHAWANNQQKFKNALMRKTIPRAIERSMRSPKFIRPEAMAGNYWQVRDMVSKYTKQPVDTSRYVYPLAGVPMRDRHRFVEQLEKEEREKLRKAIRWYESTARGRKKE